MLTPQVRAPTTDAWTSRPPPSAASARRRRRAARPPSASRTPRRKAKAPPRRSRRPRPRARSAAARSARSASPRSAGRKPASGTHPAATRPATPPAPGPAAPVPPAPPAPTHASSSRRSRSTPARSAPPRPSACCGAPASARGRARPPSSPSSGSRRRCSRSPARPAPRRWTARRRTTRATPLEPYDHWGHDLLYWLDRMVRSRHQLIERLALVFHDWFATSNDAVGSSRLHARPDQPVPRPRAAQLQDAWCAQITQDPAMILFLDQAVEPQGRDQRELRPRADGAVHARRRPRGLHGGRRARARALAERLGLRLEQRARRPQLPLGRAGPLGPGLQDRVRQDAGAGRGRTPRGWSSSTPSTRRSSSRSCGATSSRRRRTRRRRRQARGALQGLGLRDPPGARGDPDLARSSTRARGWSSRRPCSWPGCCAPASAGSPPTRGRGCCPAPASASTTRRTSRAGTTSAGSTPTPRSGAGRRSSYALERRHRGAGLRRLPGRVRGPGAGQGARRSGAPRRSPARGVSAPLDTFARQRDPRHRRAVAARAAPERAAPADRRLPRLPDPS